MLLWFRSGTVTTFYVRLLTFLLRQILILRTNLYSIFSLVEGIYVVIPNSLAFNCNVVAKAQCLIGRMLDQISQTYSLNSPIYME